MGRIIAVANQKGGVGKTTTSINLSAALAEENKKILVIDADPQGNTTSGFGLDKNEIDRTIYHLMIGESTVDECIRHNIVEDLPGIDIIPSNINLSAAEIELIDICKAEVCSVESEAHCLSEAQKGKDGLVDVCTCCFLHCDKSFRIRVGQPHPQRSYVRCDAIRHRADRQHDPDGGHQRRIRYLRQRD